ncbi:MAG TPA: glycosyltransferase family 39 protein [Armatimonadota bacterium]|jgi:4-amino-4-deoxy-L-arabinose transferase-like glycosyltransferase
MRVETSVPPVAAAPRREWRNVSLLMLVAAVLWVPLYWQSRFVALLNPDAQDYAQIARNILEGKGMLSNTMPLCGLEWMKQTGRLGMPWWNVHRFPFPSVIEAGLFRIFGANDFAAVLFSAIFFFATIPLVFLIARRLFSYRVAMLAAFLYVFAGGPMRDSITGLTEPAATFFFVWALYLVVWPRNRWSYALAGLITGVSFLNRSSVFLYGFPMIYLLTLAREPGGSLGRRLPIGESVRNVLAFCIPGAIVIAPWLYRNQVVAGGPLFSLTQALMARYMTDASPHTHDWYQFHYETVGHFFKAHPMMALKKWFTQMGGLWWLDWPRIGDVDWFIPALVLSVLKPYVGAAGWLRRWLFGVLLFHFFVLAVLSNIPRYYSIFTPFILIYAAEALLALWDQWRPLASRRRLWLAGFLAAPMLLNWLYIAGPPRKFREERIRFETQPGNEAWIRANTPANAVIATDIPWSVGWYGRRKALAIPPTPAEMPRYADYGFMPEGIYLKMPYHTMDLPNGWNEWRLVQYGHTPVPGYRLAHVFPDQSVFYERD